MIRVERGPAPAFFSSVRLKRERQRARAFFAKPARSRAQSRFLFLPLPGEPDVMTALRETFHLKCAYCETPVEADPSDHLDHFRPKTGSIGRDGSFSADHYWWLAYEWENLYLCCGPCNQRKGHRFPVGKRRVPAPARGAALRHEEPLLLDPCSDDPEEHLVFTEDGRVASDTERGRVTIDVLDLNREALVEARRETIAVLRTYWEVTPESDRDAGFVATATGAESEFLALRHQLLARWLAEARRVAKKAAAPPPETPPEAVPPVKARSRVMVQQVVQSFQRYEQAQEAYSLEDESRKEDYFAKTRLVRRIEIRNFKIIDGLDLTLPMPRENRAPWLMLLGENGCGKSSVLQAVSLALAGEEQRRRLGLDASRFVRHGTREGHVRVHLTGRKEPIELRFARDSKRFVAEPRETKTLILAYGATRLLPRGRTATPSRDAFARVENLFDPFSPLRDADGFLCGLTPTDFDRTARALKDLLVLGDRDRLARTRGRKPSVIVRSGRIHATLRELSDGYQSVVALAVDVMSVLSRRWSDMSVAEGIVLVDEMGSHLHPRWKMEIVSRLRRAFPRVQFLVTSHDPLCLRGLARGEVTVMRRDERNRILALADLPSPEGLRVDQLLTSEHFGLSSTVDPAVEGIFKRYYALLGQPRRTAAEEAEVAQLKGRIEGLRLFGQSPRERLVLEAADELIARRAKEADPARRQELTKEARARIQKIWAELGPDGSPTPATGGTT